MFSSSKVALIYGSAGTGKSTQINHISNFFKDKEKIYLANTHQTASGYSQNGCCAQKMATSRGWKKPAVRPSLMRGLSGKRKRKETPTRRLGGYKEWIMNTVYEFLYNLGKETTNEIKFEIRCQIVMKWWGQWGLITYKQGYEDRRVKWKIFIFLHQNSHQN